LTSANSPLVAAESVGQEVADAHPGATEHSILSLEDQARRTTSRSFRAKAPAMSVPIPHASRSRHRHEQYLLNELLDRHAFDGSPLHVDMPTYHVPFDDQQRTGDADVLGRANAAPSS
jgi:hypothetical protein